MHRRTWLLVFLTLPASVIAEPGGDVRALRQQVAALQIDHALNLTQQQARALLPLLQKAQAQVQDLEARRQAAQPALTAALTQAVSDLRATGTVSPAAVDAVNAARPVRGTLRSELRSVWQEARQILTPEQLQALKATRLGVPPPATASSSSDGARAGFGRRFRLMHAVLSDAFISLVQARAG